MEHDHPSNRSPDRPSSTNDPKQLDRLYDKAIQDEETLRRWEREQSHEPGTDTERAVKLAAMRTELLQRSLPWEEGME